MTDSIQKPTSPAKPPIGTPPVGTPPKTPAQKLKSYTVGKDVEIVSGGQRYMLEKGDKINVIPKDKK